MVNIILIISFSYKKVFRRKVNNILLDWMFVN